MTAPSGPPRPPGPYLLVSETRRGPAADLVTFDSVLKDLFPLPGQPVKQWVLDARAERAELERTGKRIAVPAHLDNTGAGCRNVGPATLVEDAWTHDCCGICNDLGEAAR